VDDLPKNSMYYIAHTYLHRLCFVSDWECAKTKNVFGRGESITHTTVNTPFLLKTAAVKSLSAGIVIDKDNEYYVTSVRQGQIVDAYVIKFT
jgi:hypothetical protein